MSEEKKKFMRRAVELSAQSMESGGGPFGAVIVRQGRIVAEGTNRVTVGCDPTAHAEMTAIRKAAESLGVYDLSGCEIYTSCEPCPMCLGAIYWARLGKIYYANDRKDAQSAGFDDSMIYDQIALPPSERCIPMQKVPVPEAIAVFERWIASEDKTKY